MTYTGPEPMAGTQGGFVPRGIALSEARQRGHVFLKSDALSVPTDTYGDVLSCQNAKCWATLVLVEREVVRGESSALQMHCPTLLSWIAPTTEKGK
jgi:hypothetical protein